MAAIRKGIRVTGIILFLVYFSVLIYLLFFAEGYGRGMESSVYDYNLHPFREISRYLEYWEILGIRTVILNLAGNIIGFVPFGVLLPLVCKNVRKWWKIMVLSLEISAIVELSQIIFQVGCFDVDDMILNTLGGILGYLIFCMIKRSWWYFVKYRSGWRRDQAVR